MFTRTKLIIGDDGLDILKSKNVIVFGIGGVGGFVVEGLVRSGICKLTLVDDDVVSMSNLNRQIIATTKTIGDAKVELMKQRALDINPSSQIETIRCFLTKENINTIDLSKFDYIVDAIDTITTKILLIEQAKRLDVPIISSMGTGNKIDPTKFEVADISKTSICPLAKVMRYELKKRRIKKVKVVYSKELPIIPYESDEYNNPEVHNGHRVLKPKRQVPGSISFCPSVAGLIIAGEVVRDFLGIKR